MEKDVVVGRLSPGPWGLLFVAACYVTALLLVSNFAFGAGTFINRHDTGSARTGGYDSRIPMVAAVDPDSMAGAVTEATGGPPTIGLPLPVTQPSVSTGPSTQPIAAPRITATTTPTYTAATQVTAISWASLVALIPTNLNFPRPAKPHRR